MQLVKKKTIESVKSSIKTMKIKQNYDQFVTFDSLRLSRLR